MLTKKIVVNSLMDVCEYPEGIDISYNENLLVVACWFEDNIILLDLDSNKLSRKNRNVRWTKSFWESLF